MTNARRRRRRLQRTAQRALWTIFAVAPPFVLAACVRVETHTALNSPALYESMKSNFTKNSTVACAERNKRTVQCLWLTPAPVRRLQFLPGARHTDDVQLMREGFLCTTSSTGNLRCLRAGMSGLRVIRGRGAKGPSPIMWQNGFCISSPGPGKMMKCEWLSPFPHSFHIDGRGIDRTIRFGDSICICGDGRATCLLLDEQPTREETLPSGDMVDILTDPFRMVKAYSAQGRPDLCEKLSQPGALDLLMSPPHSRAGPVSSPPNSP